MKSIIPGDDPEHCFICGRYGPAHVHHCLHGSRRAAADKYGLTVHLCSRCHMELHDHGAHDADLEEIAQAAFEEQHTHAEFMKIFGKNFRRKK